MATDTMSYASPLRRFDNFLPKHISRHRTIQNRAVPSNEPTAHNGSIPKLSCHPLSPNEPLQPTNKATGRQNQASRLLVLEMMTKTMTGFPARVVLPPPATNQNPSLMKTQAQSPPSTSSPILNSPTVVRVRNNINTNVRTTKLQL